MLDLPDLQDPTAIEAWVTAVTGIPAEPEVVRWSGTEALLTRRAAYTDRIPALADPVPWSSGPDRELTEEAERLLLRLAQRRPDLARLVRDHYYRQLSQRQLARLLGCSQKSVCRRLQRARALMRVSAELPEWTPVEAADRVQAAGGRPGDRSYHVLYWHYGQAGQVARVLSVSQQRAYRAVERVLELPCTAVTRPWGLLLREWPAMQ